MIITEYMQLKKNTFPQHAETQTQNTESVETDRIIRIALNNLESDNKQLSEKLKRLKTDRKKTVLYSEDMYEFNLDTLILASGVFLISFKSELNISEELFMNELLLGLFTLTAAINVIFSYNRKASTADAFLKADQAVTINEYKQENKSAFSQNAETQAQDIESIDIDRIIRAALNNLKFNNKQLSKELKRLKTHRQKEKQYLKKVHKYNLITLAAALTAFLCNPGSEYSFLEDFLINKLSIGLFIVSAVSKVNDSINFYTLDLIADTPNTQSFFHPFDEMEDTESNPTSPSITRDNQTFPLLT